MTARTCLLILAFIAAFPVNARSLSEVEKQDLAVLAQRYEAAYLKRNYWFLGASVPPRVMKRYVEGRGAADMKPDRWVALFVADSKEVERQIGATIETFELNFDRARFEEAADGEPYAILPSVSVVALRDGNRFELKSPYLALIDGGKWYLINVGFGGTMGSVKGIYPSFDEIEFDYARQRPLKGN
ncbi:MAG: hypothetical protein AAF468_12365 [Pseudomonadota bacterium]